MIGSPSVAPAGIRYNKVKQMPESKAGRYLVFIYTGTPCADDSNNYREVYHPDYGLATRQLDKEFSGGIQDAMHKRLLSILIILAAGLAMMQAYGIDGDYGVPYATDPAQVSGLAAGSGPVYGGRNKPVPPATVAGGILVLVGFGAAAYWHRRARRSTV